MFVVDQKEKGTEREKERRTGTGCIDSLMYTYLSIQVNSQNNRNVSENFQKDKEKICPNNTSNDTEGQDHVNVKIPTEIKYVRISSKYKMLI